jgi:hypothetical protein
MTNITNSRIAGFMFLFYIATGVTVMMVSARTGAGDTVAAQLANIAQHATAVRLTALLVFLTFIAALALGVSLHALTKDQDRDLALFALGCRATEGAIGAYAAVRSLSVLSVAIASTSGEGAASAQALGALLLRERGASGLIAALCFAIASTVFSYLFLKARNIPSWLAGLGVFASALLVVLLPVQIAGLVKAPMTNLMWMPMLVFELVLAFWLIIRGVSNQTTATA